MRLIDADALSKKWQDVLKEKADEKDSIAYQTFELFIDRLKNEPTIEAEPVRHGEWKDNHCTVCGMTPLGEELWEHLDIEPPKFEYFMRICPYCGAKMDGKEKKE